VMDDEAGVRRLLAHVLGERGLDVDTVANGQEAIAAYTAAMQSQRPYHAVILDLTVPGGLGGVETLERLRALDREVRAIVSSGYSAAPVMADCRSYGFAAAVPKPYTASELESVLLDVIRGRSAAAR
jgi:two-component system cell cycle sensor histidine kinase/response regulator CckA